MEENERERERERRKLRAHLSADPNLNSNLYARQKRKLWVRLSTYADRVISYIKKERLKKKIEINHAILMWLCMGRQGNCPDAVKNQILRWYGARYSLLTLVETGTYNGKRVLALKNCFKHIYSIELSNKQHKLSARSIASKHNTKHIQLLHGDSPAELAKIMNVIHKPTLFWLDAHWSGEDTAQSSKVTPVIEELEVISASPNGNLAHVILIDDVRLFGDPKAFPHPTMNELTEYIEQKFPNSHIVTENDIIAIVFNR